MNLFVGNLSPETTEQQLQDAFSEFGAIKSVKIIIDPQTGLPKGFGFVEMEEKFSAYDAIDNLDATYFMGTIISVKEAKGNKTGSRPGGGGRPFQKRPGGGGGYGGNRSGGGYNSDRPSYGNRGNNSGGYNSDRPSYGNRSNNSGGYNSDRPSYGNRSNNSGGYNSDRPSYGNKNNYNSNEHNNNSGNSNNDY